jgi:hypothetical protein
MRILMIIISLLLLMETTHFVSRIQSDQVSVQVIDLDENEEEETPPETETSKTEKKCLESGFDFTCIMASQEHYSFLCLQYNPSLYHNIVSPPPEA